LALLSPWAVDRRFLSTLPSSESFAVEKSAEADRRGQ